MARPVTLFPDAPEKKDKDIEAKGIDGYHRTAERHFRELARLNNCRQILFATNIGVITFDRRTEKNSESQDVPVTYAIQDLYTIHRNPEELTTRPKPEIFTRHEVPLRDVRQTPPTIPPKPLPA